MYQFIAQAVGFFATALQVGSFQFKSSRKLILTQLCANATFLVHLLLLGGYSGCVNVFFSCIRNLLLNSRNPAAHKKIWMWLLTAGNLIGTALTWQNIFSIFPCIAVVSLNLAGWSRNGKKIRLANIFAVSPSWLIYDIYAGSISGVITELICLGSVGISVLRYGWKALDNTD